VSADSTAAGTTPESNRRGVARRIFPTDHKIVAKQFLWAGLWVLLLAGTFAMLMRWQLAFPGRPIPLIGKLLFPEGGGEVPSASYVKLFTMHGVLMIFFALTPILGGAFPTFLVPLMVGARSLAFPRLSALSFWLFALGMAIAVLSFFVRLGTAGSGWTAYPPLSSTLGMPGLGQTLVLSSLPLVGLSSVLGGVNTLTTVIRSRAPGLSYLRLPLTIWGFFLAAILNVLFFPALVVAATLSVLDRTCGTQFFAAATGDPIAYQHLFWIFGHPEVYVLILPVWGMVGDLLSFFSRKPAFSYRGAVLALISITVFSALVYGHHMFVAGLSPMLGKVFMTFTLAISVPSELLVVGWLNTLWKGSIRLTTPMLFAMAVVLVFAIGGLTGLFLGTVSTDLYFHDSLWVVGHFHFTLSAASLFGVFAGIYFWFPKFFGRQLSDGLGKIHFWITVPCVIVVFGGLLVAGYHGEQRRLYNPFEFTYNQPLRNLSLWTSVFAFVLFAAQIVFVINLFRGLFFGPRAPANPWEVGTLEWSLSSPPPRDNFDVPPRVYRGPHEFSDPEVLKQLERDWIGQAEAPGT
jgi:cytochrome c oxidase subunit I